MKNMQNRRINSLIITILTVMFSIIMQTTTSTLTAQTLVKSVDAEGNVTYSDKPVPEAKTVSEISVNPGPGKDEINAAKELADKNISAAQEIRSDDKKQSNTTAIKPQTAQPDNNNSNTQYGVPYRRPLLRPRPPSSRPGIRPPPANLPARPGGGRGR